MSPKAISVLMIDDSEQDYVFMNQLLAYKPKSGDEGEGDSESEFKVAWAESMDQATQKLKEADFDAVLLDYYMPKVEGFDALVLLVKQAPLTPAILLTGTESEQIGQAAVERGAQDYLVKGKISRQVLVRAIRYAITRLWLVRHGSAAANLADQFDSGFSHLRAMREAARALESM